MSRTRAPTSVAKSRGDPRSKMTLYKPPAVLAFMQLLGC
jgi:hypothetical protein